jgi:hypothetical protein
MIQSIVPVDARTSGIQLTVITFGKFYSFLKAFQREQEYTLHETLVLRNYIAPDVRNFMVAYNREKNILGELATTMLNSNKFLLDNAEVKF